MSQNSHCALVLGTGTDKWYATLNGTHAMVDLKREVSEILVPLGIFLQSFQQLCMYCSCIYGQEKAKY